MKCASCNSDNHSGQNFCGNCGAQLEPTALDANALSAIDARVLAILQDRFRDQKVVEFEMAQAVVTRLFDWSKLLGLAAALPLAILLATLAIWGISSFLDFRTKVAAGRAQITEAIARANSQVADAIQNARGALQRTQNEAQAVKDQLSLAKKQLAALPGEVKTLQAKVTHLDQSNTLLAQAFGDDENSAVLRSFWRPNGKVDSDHARLLQDWIDANVGQNLDPATFINAASYADARKKAVAALVLVADPNVELLRNFWLPNGKVDPDHARILQAWIDANVKQGLSKAIFIHGASYADARKKAVAALVK